MNDENSMTSSPTSRDCDRTSMDSQPCEICGRLNSPFGYGPPVHPQSIWRCGEHRLEGPAPKLDPADVIQRAVSGWIESNWPAVTDPGVCQHCGRRDDNLIPVGYGERPRVWLHPECSDVWRAELHRKARVALARRTMT